MARWMEPTPEQLATHLAWIANKPAHLRPICERFPPWELFRMKSTNHRVIVIAYFEHDDGTCTLRVVVDGRFNHLLMARTVFGVPPDDLEPCELPLSGEFLGAILDREEAEDCRDGIRDMIAAWRRERTH